MNPIARLNEPLRFRYKQLGKSRLTFSRKVKVQNETQGLQFIPRDIH